VASVPIDAAGAFTIVVPVGHYRLKVDNGPSPFPICTPIDVDVTTAANVAVEIVCDTGIR
jgi:hypothetical protein